MFKIFSLIIWDRYPKVIRNYIVRRRLDKVYNSFKRTKYFRKSGFPEFLSKSLIREIGESEFLAKSPRFGFKYTSGSSGQPFRVAKWRFSDLYEYLMGERAMRRVGAPFRPRVLVLRSYSPVNGVLTKYSSLRNWYYFSPYHLNNKYLEDIVSYYKKVRPQVIKGYPSTIFLLTKLLKDHSIKLDSPKLIFTSSETFPGNWRDFIKDYWECPILDWYGQNERTAIIHQCINGNYHTNEDYGRIEIDDVTGEIIATTLLNNVFPLIRYRTGDIAQRLDAQVTCGCNVKGPIQLSGIQGRIDDLLIDGNDDLIPPTNFYSLFEKLNLDQFTITQQKSRKIIVGISGWDSLDEITRSHVISELESRLKNCHIEIENLKQLDRNRLTEKHKIIKNLYNVQVS